MGHRSNAEGSSHQADSDSEKSGRDCGFCHDERTRQYKAYESWGGTERETETERERERGRERERAEAESESIREFHQGSGYFRLLGGSEFLHHRVDIPENLILDAGSQHLLCLTQILIVWVGVLYQRHQLGNKYDNGTSTIDRFVTLLY